MGALDGVIPPHLELVPGLNEVYELELAIYESRILTDKEIIRNGAYFARVGGVPTRHFRMCQGEPVKLPDHSSSRLKSFFETNQFRTGYGTHGLFPYRGKFHPQMIKALLNVMGLRSGDSVLDPMMGSGTVLIEASLMGIESFGVDASPFCTFMTRAKLDGLTLPLNPLRDALAHPSQVYDYFRSASGPPRTGSKNKKGHGAGNLLHWIEQGEAESTTHSRGALPPGCEEESARRFLLLAYLDAAGYSERSSRQTPFAQFKAILERYVFVVEKVQRVLAGAEDELGESKPETGDARDLCFKDNTLDGVLFSPPYSFAIDYLDNDAFHLGYLGIDTADLRQRMVGLVGADPAERFSRYRVDMERVIAECARVLRHGRFCTIVVGTNTNQLGRILGVAPDEVQGIDDMLIEFGGRHGLSLTRKMSRQITGMANTMRTESIVLLRKD